MGIQTFKAKISDIQELNPEYRLIRAELISPSRLEFKSGQNIILSIPGEAQKRTYSMFQSPATTHAVELFVDMRPMGLATSYLSQRQLGDELEFMAPSGAFVLTEENLAVESSLVFVATGSGLAPLRSMILDLLQVRQDTRPITLYWGMRSEAQLMFLEEFEELQRSFPNFHVHLTLSQPTDAWPLCEGRVTDCLANHDLPQSAGYYVCGNSQMIQDVFGILEKRGVPKEQLHREQFY